LRTGDNLVVLGAPDSILKASESQGLETLPELHGTAGQGDSGAGQLEMVEVALAPQSRLQGQTLKEADLRARYGVTVLATRHQGVSLVSGLAGVLMELGDALLIQGSQDRIAHLRREDDFLVLDSPPTETRRTHKRSSPELPVKRAA
jgi:K+/H+ antiporter YhaU regulatory subunit KhtT